MVRTWALMIGLALLWSSVCTGQDLYVDMAPTGIELTGMTPLSYNSLFTVAPETNSDGPRLDQTLAGVQANLSIFEQSDAASGLPLNLSPYWGNLPNMSQIQSGMGVQQPQDISTFINIANASPNSTGLLNGLGVPISGLTINGADAFQMPDFAGQVQMLNP
jgi:hypothetical protein